MRISAEQERRDLAMELSVEMSFQLNKSSDMSALAKKVASHIVAEADGHDYLGQAILMSTTDRAEAGRMLQDLFDSGVASYVEEHEADLRETFKREHVA